MKNHKKHCQCGACKAERGETFGRNNPMFGRKPKPLSKQALENISKAHKNKPLTLAHRKKLSLAKLDKYFGENNPFYGKHHTKQIKKQISINTSIALGGTGIPYENNDYPMKFFKIRNKILELDNYICQECLEYGNEVHHIDYDKENNKEDNLICLCRKCNMRANFNRNYWKKYFKTLIEINYGLEKKLK